MVNQTSASQENSNSGFFVNLKELRQFATLLGTLGAGLTFFYNVIDSNSKEIKEDLTKSISGVEEKMIENINDVKSNVEDVQDDVKDLLVVTTENKTTLEHLKQKRL